MTTPTLADAVTYIADRADEQDLLRILGAVNARRTALRAITAAAVRIGAAVRLDGLSPKYLDGLTGVVRRIHGKHAEVELDEESTRNLRYVGSPRHPVSSDVMQYLLYGVPLSCCHSAD